MRSKHEQLRDAVLKAAEAEAAKKDDGSLVKYLMRMSAERPGAFLKVLNRVVYLPRPE